MARVAWLLLAAVLVSGCPDPLQPQQYVAELRVLAIRLDPPDARPGDEVTATALVVDEVGREWTTTWYACETPISTADYFSASFDPAGSLCDDPERPFGHEIGAGPSATFTVPESFLDDAGALLAAAGLDDGEGSVDQLLTFIGWHMRINVVAERTDGTDQVQAFKRLVVSGLGVGNTNPGAPVLYVQRDDVASEVEPPPATTPAPTDGTCLAASSPEQHVEQGEDYILTPVNLPEVYEEYPQIDFLGETSVVSEELWFSWASTHLALRHHITRPGDPDNLFQPRRPRYRDMGEDTDGGMYVPIWVVVRDGRGGTSWCTQELPFVPSAP
jgi:hypothetical protein